MGASNVLVAFAAMGSLTTAALADDKVAVATPPGTTTTQAHAQYCETEKKVLAEEGDAIEDQRKASNGSPTCQLGKRANVHSVRTLALIDHCPEVLGMSTEEASSTRESLVKNIARMNKLCP